MSSLSIQVEKALREHEMKKNMVLWATETDRERRVLDGIVAKIDETNSFIMNSLTDDSIFIGYDRVNKVKVQFNNYRKVFTNSKISMKNRLCAVRDFETFLFCYEY